MPDSIVKIEKNAFMHCKGLKTVTIMGNSVTEIGQAAFFGCEKLEKINIPESVTRIGNQAFALDESLTEIVLPSKITTMEFALFADCTSLKSVSIPDGVTNIQRSVFSGCESLKSITIPESVSLICDCAFERTPITSIYLPKNVLIDGDPFFDCKSLAEILVDSESIYHTSIDGVLFNRSADRLVCYPNGKTDKSYSVPYGTQYIDGAAFAGNLYLESVTIPDGCDFRFTRPDSGSPSGAAFRDCSKLKTVYLPATITSIYFAAFAHCDNLTDVYYNGCKERWAKISIDSANDPLLAANIHYNDNDYLIKGVEIEVDKTQTTLKFEPFEGINWPHCRVLYNGEITYASDLGYRCKYPAPAYMVREIGSEKLPKGGDPSDYVIEVYAYDSDDKEVFIGSVCLADGIPHEHQFLDEWLNDNSSHWHKCELCSEVSDKAKHSLVDGVCTVCGAEIEFMPGDINGDGAVDVQDGVLMQRILANLESNEEYKSRADLNGDNKVDVQDGVKMQRILAHLE